MNNGAEVLENLCKSQELRKQWFGFYKNSLPILRASLDCAETYKLNEAEALQVSICMMCQEQCERLTEEWKRSEGDKMD